MFNFKKFKERFYTTFVHRRVAVPVSVDRYCNDIEERSVGEAGLVRRKLNAETRLHLVGRSHKRISKNSPIKASYNSFDKLVQAVDELIEKRGLTIVEAAKMLKVSRSKIGLLRTIRNHVPDHIRAEINVLYKPGTLTVSHAFALARAFNAGGRELGYHFYNDFRSNYIASDKLREKVNQALTPRQPEPEPQMTMAMAV